MHSLLMYEKDDKFELQYIKENVSTVDVFDVADLSKDVSVNERSLLLSNKFNFGIVKGEVMGIFIELLSGHKGPHDITWILDTEVDYEFNSMHTRLTKLMEQNAINPNETKRKLDEIAEWSIRFRKSVGFSFFDSVGLLSIMEFGYTEEDLERAIRLHLQWGHIMEHKLYASDFRNMSDDEVRKFNYGDAWHFIGKLSPEQRSFFTVKNYDWAKEVDVEYFNPECGIPKLIDFLKAGVKPTSLFPNVTRKEANGMANDPAIRGSRFTYGYELYVYKQFVLNRDKHSWYTYPADITTIRWALRNADKLEGSETVIGPNGTKITVHYNRIVHLISEVDLDRGEFTGWKRVFELVMRLMKEEMLAQFKEDVPLPVFPVHGVESEDIRQLTTSHELVGEGIGMDHCVGSYIKACMEEECYIFHVDDGSKSGATVEVNPNDVFIDEEGWTIKQSMRAKNKPSQTAADIVYDRLVALGEYVNPYNGGELMVG